MTRSHITLKAVLAACMAALVALAIAGCSSSSQSSASSASSSAESDSSAASDASASAETESASAESVTIELESDTVGAGIAAATDDKATTGKSSSSASASSTSSSSASATSTSSIATGTLVDVTNETTGYTFKADKGYSVKFDGSKTTVYTSKTSGAVPYFELSTMQNSTGRTVEDLLNGIGNDVLKNYKDKLVAGPIANKVKLGGRTIKGIEYVRLNDKGDKKLAVMEYVEEYSGTFFTWRTICYANDAETPAAMQEAIATFKFLAS